MKQIKKWTLSFGLVLSILFFSVLSFAQDKGADVNVDINKGGGSNWYSSPWVWIVGAALFILLLVALLRGNSSRD
jgi:hypothetical protein